MAISVPIGCSSCTGFSPRARSTIPPPREGCGAPETFGSLSSTATTRSARCTGLLRPRSSRSEWTCSARFANEGDGGERFIHPVVRAILLHFWLAYDHPFEDGNGRTARILFFWSMHRSGYWLAEYLPISRLIRAAPAQYGRAFLESESDEGDTTYFLLHQLRVIERAIQDLHDYLSRKVAEQHDVERMLDVVDGLNGRQVVLLTHAAKHPGHAYTFGGHARSHRVTHETARADLGGLAKGGLLTRHRRGREYFFEPAPDLPQRLRESGA